MNNIKIVKENQTTNIYIDDVPVKYCSGYKFQEKVGEVAVLKLDLMCSNIEIIEKDVEVDKEYYLGEERLYTKDQVTKMIKRRLKEK